MRHTAEKAASAFPGLLIAAERIADAVIHGGHGRRRSGPGEDFWQYRPYSPGDPASRIDWRRSAKRNRLYIRENEWAATNTLWTHVAAGPGMDFKSDLAPVTKNQRAATLALALSILAIKAGERAAILNAPMAPGHTRATINKISHWYETENLQAASDDRQAGLSRQQKPPKFATCALFGDFFAPIEELKQQFNLLASAGVSGHVIQVLDPIEETFPFTGRTRFLDPASNQSVLAGRAETLRQTYIEKLSRHRGKLRDLCQSLGWHFILHHTDRPAHIALVTLYHLIGQQTPSRQFSRKVS